MNRAGMLQWRGGIVIALCVGGAMLASGQQQRVIVLQHADSLMVRLIDGEDVRELIGNVAITQENVHITCDRALQFLRQGKVNLVGNMVVRDDSLTLRAPRGTYYRDARRAEAFDDVVLFDGTVHLTALYGEYLIDARRALFHTRVVVIDSTSEMAADTLTYYRSTRRSLATGNVRVHNARDHVTIYGGRLDHDAARAYSRMTINPLLVQIDTADGGRFDTLQVRGQILEAYRDSTQRLVATDSVEVVRTELAAVAQYACFYTRGDSIHLRRQPVIWYKDTQVSGDSITVYLRNRKLRRLNVLGNAFAVSQSDSLHPGRFDQLNGDWLTMHFDSDGLRRTDVEGRAISVYHLYDDSLANGLNKTSGDRIVLLFAEGKATTITVHGGVEGQYVPENMVARRHQEYAIPGFQWRPHHPRMMHFIPFSVSRAH